MKNLLAVFLPLFAALPSRGAELPLGAKLAEVKGTVSARASAEAAWTEVKDGVMLAPGGEVKTEDGASAVLAFSDNNKVRLGSKASFALEGATTAKTSLRLLAGRLECWIKRVNKAEFTVRHRSAVASVRGTVFAMEGSDTGAKIELFEGGLDIVDAFGRPTTLAPGQAASVSQSAGLEGIASLPPEVKAPEEPKVEAPPAPKVVAALPPAPPAEIATEPEQAPAATSPKQESATTVSPSSP